MAHKGNGGSGKTYTPINTQGDSADAMVNKAVGDVRREQGGTTRDGVSPDTKYRPRKEMKDMTAGKHPEYL